LNGPSHRFANLEGPNLGDIHMSIVINKDLLLEDRFFCPILKPETDKSIIGTVAVKERIIAFNHPKLFSLRKSERNKVWRKGLHDYYSIPDKTQVWLITTAPDSFLQDYYSDGLKRFKQDVRDLQPDRFMSPDWFMYDEMSVFEQEKSLSKAIAFSEACLDLDGLIPSANTVCPEQFTRVVDCFQSVGYREFIMPSREHLMRNPHKKRNEERLAVKIQKVIAQTGAEIIVNGTSSPRQHRFLFMAKGFIGLNWQLHSDMRRMFFNGNFVSILKDKFQDLRCNNPLCCRGEKAKNLAGKENTLTRYLHNLHAIQNQIKQLPERRFIRKTLGDF